MRKTTRWLALIAMLSICSVRINAADTDSITAKSEDGAYLALDDGTKWLITKSDQKTAAAWLVTDDVVTVDSSKVCSAAELIDIDENNESVCAIDASSHTSSISDKSDDGTYISLNDGSQWIVDDGDTSTSSSWNEGDDVIALSGSRFCSHAELINTDDDGDEVCSSPARSH